MDYSQDVLENVLAKHGLTDSEAVLKQARKDGGDYLKEEELDAAAVAIKAAQKKQSKGSSQKKSQKSYYADDTNFLTKKGFVKSGEEVTAKHFGSKEILDYWVKKGKVVLR